MNSYISEWIAIRYGKDLSVNEMENAFTETVQSVILQALSSSSFFRKAAFYGGTCLRFCYGMERFSEDLDFSLKVPDISFDLESFFPQIKKNLSLYGLDMEVEMRKKKAFSQVQSAFVKGNTLVNFVNVFSIEPPVSGIAVNRKLTVKFEIDTDPPCDATYEERAVNSFLYPFSVFCYDLPSQFAGKIDAVLMRNWKNRVKGRDFFDYLWFLHHGVHVNTSNLKARLKQHSGKDWSEADIRSGLHERFALVDFSAAVEDVSPFVSGLALESIRSWSGSLFSMMTDQYLVFS